MSQTNSINTRIQHKHDTEANWLKATTFIPKAGELIIYDVDDNNATPRFKVGDGSTVVTNLPFSNEGSISGGDDKVSKAGDTMTGDLAIEKVGPTISLNHTTSARTGRLAATGDDYVSLYNEVTNDASNNNTALWLAPENISDTDNLLKINRILNGESNTYKVLHDGMIKYKIFNYNSLADLGLSGEITTAEVMTAMPAYSKVIISNTSANSTYITDIPVTYATVELTKSSGYYGYGLATQVGYASPKSYTYHWYSSSNYNGWRENLNTSNNITITNTSPYLHLNDSDNERTMTVGMVGAEKIGVIYNVNANDSSQNRAGLWIGAETVTDDNLLKVQKLVDGTSTTYKVLHAGTQEAKKLEYTNIAYGTCSTAAATAAKEVTIEGNSNWALTKGAIIYVNIVNTNTVNEANTITMNVNNTGAKPIYYYNTRVGTSYYGSALTKGINVFIYDGTNYHWMGHSIDTNTTYTNQSLGNGYGQCDTAAATVAKVVTLSGYKLVTHGMVSVKFTYDVPASATMNINSTGAKPIYHNMAAIKAGVIKAGDLATFILTGSYYMLIAIDRVPIDYTATITTTWSGTSAPYSQNITVTGITANDKPVVDVVMSGTYSTDTARLTDWSKIYRIVTAADKITVYATAKTAVSLPIQLRSVR